MCDKPNPMWKRIVLWPITIITAIVLVVSFVTMLLFGVIEEFIWDFVLLDLACHVAPHPFGKWRKEWNKAIDKKNELFMMLASEKHIWEPEEESS